MSSSAKLNVAICGAGLAGFSLALSLNSRGISCTIYDAAERPQTVIKGSINLAPNGQAVIDDIGILERILPKTCTYRDVIIRDNQGTPISKMLVGRKETFKYDSIRLLRADLIDAFAKAANERGIQFVCNKKFESVVSESKEEVTFKFEDSTTASASLLIGADGIFSHIRNSMYPDLNVDYIGHMAIMSVVDSKVADLETEKHQGMTLGNEIGTMMLGHNNEDPSSWVVVLQKVHPDLGKVGWKQFGEDKQALKEYMRKDYDKWPTYCQRALDSMDEESLFLWPMYTAPALPSWSSSRNRVLLIGDAAHAMPPSGGQGASQAFEDSATLALVLEQVQKGNKELGPALEFWEHLRKERVQKVMDFTAQMTKLRAPGGQPAEALGELSADEARVELLRAMYGGIPAQEEKIKIWAGAA